MGTDMLVKKALKLGIILATLLPWRFLPNSIIRIIKVKVDLISIAYSLVITKLSFVEHLY